MTAPIAPQFEPIEDLAGLSKGRVGQVRFVDVPEWRFLAVDGAGAPGGSDYQAAFGALYPVAFALHFALKRRGIQAPIGRLEGLYWRDVAAEAVPAGRNGSSRPDWNSWCWRLMLPVPAAATDAEVTAAIIETSAKKGEAAVANLAVLRSREGPCAQTLHVGPYGEEQPTLERLHAAIARSGLRPRGIHHEIYLSDPARTPAARIRTIIRQPVEPAEPAA